MMEEYHDPDVAFLVEAYAAATPAQQQAMDRIVSALCDKVLRHRINDKTHTKDDNEVSDD